MCAYTSRNWFIQTLDAPHLYIRWLSGSLLPHATSPVHSARACGPSDLGVLEPLFSLMQEMADVSS